MKRLYIPQGITLEALTSQLGELGELDSELGRDAIATHQLMLDLRSKRQQAGRYAPDDVAAMLAEQTEQDASYWMAKISGAWSSGLLKFWLQDGTPCDHLSGMERYLGLDNEYTTSEAVNDWLEKWGAEYRLNDDNKLAKLIAPSIEPVQQLSSGWEVVTLKSQDHLAGYLREILCDAHKTDPITPPRRAAVIEELVDRAAMEPTSDAKGYVYTALGEHDRISKDALRKRVDRMIAR